MLDQAKKQKIYDLIQTSTILTAQEKTDWLSLLELMNDKQISELEEILQQKHAGASKPVPAAEGNFGTPSLSHISNLPNQISSAAFGAPTPRPAAQNPSAAPSVEAADEVQAAKIIAQKFARTAPHRPQPAPRVQPPAPPVRPVRSAIAPSPVPAQLHLTDLPSVAKLTIDALHAQNRQSFFEQITALAKQDGYFQVLTQFESSPLYKDYLNYGRLKLSTPNAANLPLSQEEFEFVSDLLLALKVNRL